MNETFPAAVCEARGHHTTACFDAEEYICPRCKSEWVVQQRPQCGALEPYPLIECIVCSLACPDCQSEVRVTVAQRTYARVIHSATCPWYRAYQAGGMRGRIPCGVVVTHRGPYKRRPEELEAGR